MKKKNLRMKLITRVSLVIALIATITIVSCDNELNSLGNGLIGVDPNDTILQQEFEVTTFSSPVNAVQTDNFNSYVLGTYADPVYGVSQYSIVSQVTPSFLNPEFDQDSDPATSPELTSVFLEIPYFSTITDFDGEVTTYRIDSIYGGGAMDLRVYRNKFLLNDFDPANPGESATYFSDFKSAIDAVSTGANEELIYANNSFTPSNQEILIRDSEGEITERKSPRIRIALNEPDELQYWSDILLNSDRENFRSITNFKDFFRGIYITAERSSITGPGTMFHLNFNEAALLFSVEIPLEDTEDPLTSEYRFDFTGANVGNSIKVNFIENDIPAAVTADIAASFNEDLGAENLYLKGGSGAMAFVDLFGSDLDGDGEADALTEMIENQWLINDAILDVYVNQSIVQGGAAEPERIIVYDFVTGRILSDYILSSQSTALNANVVHLGRLDREDNSDEDSNGVKYQIRLTNHINSIINGVVENNRLAIAVTQNVTLFGSNDVKSQTSPLEIETITEGTAISHEGTVLHGTRSLEIDKRPKFNIYYSNPTN
jgi:hypothetical protein